MGNKLIRHPKDLSPRGWIDTIVSTAASNPLIAFQSWNFVDSVLFSHSELQATTSVFQTSFFFRMTGNGFRMI
jgi:hypothetical protein